MPEYLIDCRSGDGQGKKYAAYSSGAVRWLGWQEYAYLKDDCGVYVVILEDAGAGNRLPNYDGALRGLVKERD
jgi:hypothetical protein